MRSGRKFTAFWIALPASGAGGTPPPRPPGPVGGAPRRVTRRIRIASEPPASLDAASRRPVESIRRPLLSMEYKDYYDTLGVQRDADAKEVKRAYRRLALQYHPDKNPDDKAAEERFKEINEAYEVLGGREKRAKYGQLGASYRA